MKGVSGSRERFFVLFCRMMKNILEILLKSKNGNDEKLAIVSHFLHNQNFSSVEPYYHQALEILGIQKKLGASVKEMDSFYQGDLLGAFFDVPFPPPKDVKFTFIDLFAGIGGFRIALQNLGGRCVFSSEWDKQAQKTYFSNYGEMPFGDITKEEVKQFIPDNFDILCAGFPCQAFSIAGQQRGFEDTRGTLFFDVAEIIKRRHPKVVFLENVSNLLAHDKGNTFKVILSTLQSLGYDVHYKVLNALDYGVLQNRRRIIIVGFIKKTNFVFPSAIKLKTTLSDILEENVASKYFVSDAIRESRLQRLKDKNFPRPYISHENMAGSITPHHYSSALRAGASANYILINDARRPTEREMLRIQGFPEQFKVVVPYSVLKKQCGNSVAIPMIAAVAEKIVVSFKNLKYRKKYETSKAKRFQ